VEIQVKTVKKFQGLEGVDEEFQEGELYNEELRELTESCSKSVRNSVHECTVVSRDKHAHNNSNIEIDHIV